MMMKKYICCIGRPSYQKNPLFLVEVVKEVHKTYPDLEFRLLGVGYYSPDLSEMESKIKEYGLNDVLQLVPWLSHKETLEHVNNSLLYLTVARYEGLPLAVIEAMSLGKAIIASDVVGNKDCVIDGYNGRLLPLEEMTFAKAICELIANDKQRNYYERNSRILFEEKFLIEKRISELEDIYNSKSMIDKLLNSSGLGGG